MGQNYVITQAPDTAEVGLPEPECDLATDTVVIPVKLCNLPPLNAVASQVLALSANPDVDLGQLSDIMKRDPAFAADVLLLANSSLFGFPQRMHSLLHAAAVLGLERIQALAVTVAMRGFLGKNSPLIRQCWQHSAASALICEELAPIFGVTSDVAYTAGLMHDIGLLGFVKSYRKEIETVLTTAYDTVEQVLAAEKALLGVHHGRAGAWLVRNWALPATLEECCEHHHEAFSLTDPDLLKVVKAGSKIADALSFSAFRYTEPPSYDEAVWSAAVTVHRDRFPSGPDLRASVESKLAVFG